MTCDARPAISLSDLAVVRSRRVKIRFLPGFLAWFNLDMDGELNVRTAILVTFCMASAALADAPKVPTDAPYIVLSQNLDEPNGYGFCIDTLGPGQSDLMQTHSCKPAKAGAARDYAGHDVRFGFDAATGQVQSYAFEGFCMQVLLARGASVFALLECSDHPRQKFIVADDETLRLAEDTEACVVVANETEPAGPWVKRALQVQPCVEVESERKQWTVMMQ